MVFFLPCDWRFLPKLGPHLGAALLFVSYSILSTKQLLIKSYVCCAANILFLRCNMAGLHLHPLPGILGHSPLRSAPTSLDRSCSLAPFPRLPADPERNPRRGGDCLPQADAARRHDPADQRRHLCLAAAGP